MDVPALLTVQAGVSVAALLLLWLLETWLPLFVDRPHRLRHASRNLVIGGLNLAIIGLFFASATAAVTGWARSSGVGLLHWFSWPFAVKLALGVLLFDAWMYLWHRANHAVPLL